MNASRIQALAMIQWMAPLGNPMAWTQLSSDRTHPKTKDRARVALAHALPELDGTHLRASVAMSPSSGAPLSWKQRRMANASRVPAAQRSSLSGNTAIGAIHDGHQFYKISTACFENPGKRRT